MYTVLYVQTHGRDCYAQIFKHSQLLLLPVLSMCVCVCLLELKEFCSWIQFLLNNSTQVGIKGEKREEGRKAPP